MQTTLSLPRLSVAFWCHLPLVSIKLPHVPIDRELFPAAGDGFEGVSMCETFWWFGAKYGLVDISGRTKNEIRDDLWRSFSTGLMVEPVRFLQCLDYVLQRQADGLATVPTFERIVAYMNDGTSICAEPNGQRFDRVKSPSHETPWKSGTFGLFCIVTL